MSNKIFFTSDQHFSHQMPVDKRGFNSIDEHDNFLIEQWNSVVKTGDRVYQLGDFLWSTCEDPLGILKRLNGEIYLIKGNHDKDFPIIKLEAIKRFVWIKDVFMLKIKNGINIPSTKIWLSHYRHENWPDAHHNSFHFFGHEHFGNACSHYTPRTDIPRRYDVGADGNNFKPYSFEELVEILKKQGLYETGYAEKLKNASCKHKHDSSKIATNTFPYGDNWKETICNDCGKTIKTEGVY